VANGLGGIDQEGVGGGSPALSGMWGEMAIILRIRDQVIRNRSGDFGP